MTDLSEGTEGTPGRSFLIPDAARLLGVSRRTVYYRIRQGRLRTIRTRCGSQRVLLSSIDEMLADMRDAGGITAAITDKDRRAAVDARAAAASGIPGECNAGS